MCTMSDKRMHPATRVTLAFCVSVLIFGAIGMVWLIRKNRPAEQKPTVEQPRYTKEDGLRLLLIFDDGGTALHMTMLAAEPASQTVTCTALPPETAASATDRRLCDRYAEKGGAACAAEAARILGLGDAYYGVMDAGQIAAFLDKCESALPFTVTERLSYDDESTGYSLHMEPGRYTLTGATAVKLLQYPAWKNGALIQAKVQADVVAAWWNTYATADRGGRLNDNYRVWFNYAGTDCGIAAFTAKQEALRFLAAQNRGTLAKAVLPAGRFTSHDGTVRFLIADDKGDAA